MQPSPPTSTSGRRVGRPFRRARAVSGEQVEEQQASGEESQVQARPHDRSPQSRRESSPGHLGYMRALRRSVPSTNWDGVGEFRTNASARHTPRAPSEGFRVHRMRRPADFGADLGMTNVSRSRSVSGGLQSVVGASCATDPRFEGYDNSPPVTSVKIGDGIDERARAQSRAIAALQKMFFEEMASGNQDANSAAAAALRRLSEATQGRGSFAEPSVIAESTVPQQAHPNAACGLFTPRRPSTPGLVSPQQWRRPARMMRVAVQS